MARPAKFTDDMVKRSQQIVKEADTARQLRTGLSILIPKVCGACNADTAKVLGVGLATVVRMQKQIRNQVAGKAVAKESWGGRRRQHLTLQEEAEFLEPWIAKAEKGGVLVVPPIHAALQDRLKRPVAASTVYRMLARHGWRKVEPDTCHPKRDVQAQEEFKKNFPKRWRKLPHKTA
jgi:transposase